MSAGVPQPLLSTDGARGRDAFALDRGCRHLNHGSYGAVPARTLGYQAGLKTEMEANPSRWFEGLPARHEAARVSISAFVGVPVDEVAMIPNASAGASVVFDSIRLRPGDEMLITDHVYGAVLMGAERCANQWGARLRVVPISLSANSDDTLSRILLEVRSQTRVVIVDHISSATAREFPVLAMTKALADRNIVVLVDGAHALGVLPTPAVRAPHVVWLGNLHKYACAPRGAAVLIAQGALAQTLFPLIDSWGARMTYPERFDYQGSIDSTGFLSAPHALDTLQSLFGWDRIRRYSSELGSWGAALIAPELGLLMDDDPVVNAGMPIPQQPILRMPPGVAVDGASARDLKRRLAVEAHCEVGISTWRDRGFIRLSAHAYNEAPDFEQFVERGLPIIASESRASR